MRVCQGSGPVGTPGALSRLAPGRQRRAHLGASLALAGTRFCVLPLSPRAPADKPHRLHLESRRGVTGLGEAGLGAAAAVPPTSKEPLGAAGLPGAPGPGQSQHGGLD